MNRNKADVDRCLFALGVVPVLLYLLSHAISFAWVGSGKAVLWGMRLVDVFDLVLAGPFWAVILYRLHENIVDQRTSLTIARVSLLLIGAHLYGQGMHIAANAVNTYSTEIHNYLHRIPEDSYRLLYFFDESLSHHLMFVALLAVYGLWVYAEREQQTRSRGVSIVIGSAVIHGLSIGVGMIEGQFSQQALVLYGVLLGLIGVLIRVSRLSPRNYLESRPFSLFVACFASCGIVVIIVYTLVAGGLVPLAEYLGLHLSRERWLYAI